MKKIIVLMMAISLIFSINGFSQDKTNKTVQSGKTEQPGRKNAKNGRQPRKSVSNKKIQKPHTVKRTSKKQTGNSIKL